MTEEITAVRTTERNIPKGFEPKDLGQVGDLVTHNPSDLPDPSDPGCYLISYYTSPITKGSTNKYIVFVVDNNLQKKVKSYKWSVREELSSDDDMVAEPHETEYGMFEYTPNNPITITVKVSLLDDNGEKLRILKIRQCVRSSYDALERLLKYSEIDVNDEILEYRTALGAHPDTSREVLNDLYQFIKMAFEPSYLFSWDNVPGTDSERLLRFLTDDIDIGWAENAEILKSDDDGKTIRIFTDENSAEIIINETEGKATLEISNGRTHDLKVKKEYDKLNIYGSSINEENKVPLKLLAAIVYLQVFRVPKERTAGLSLENRFRNLEIDNVAQLLNGEYSWAYSTEIYSSLGVCQISPETLAMIVTDPDAPPDRDYTTYTKWIDLPQDEDQRQEMRDQIRQNYLDLTEDTKAVQIDLFNLLRFPKSNIQMCFYLLNHLKNRTSTSRYHDLTTEQFLNNERALKIVATEFEIGGTDTKEDEAKSSAYGDDALKVMKLPMFTIGFGGHLELNIIGSVYDEDEVSFFNSLDGAKVYLYKTMLRVTTNNLKCFKSYDTINSATPEEYLMLTFHDDGTPQATPQVLPVLEVRRSPEEYPNSDLIKVKKESEKLDYNEGWIVARSGGDYYALLESHRLENDSGGPLATVGSLVPNAFGFFGFTVNEYQPYFIRVVKDPNEEQKGYFDGEWNGKLENLARGWFLPPRIDLRISMKPAKYLIKESEIVSLLSDWKNYKYDKSKPNKYPAGYYIKEIGIDEGPDRNIVCNTFVEALLVQAWHVSYPGSFQWKKRQHALVMIQNEWMVDATLPNGGEFNPDIDIFSSVNVYIEKVIRVKSNPDSGAEFTVSIGGESVTITAGATESATAQEIANELRKVAAITVKVHVLYGKTGSDFLAIRSIDIAKECDYQVDIETDSGSIEVSPTNENPVFSALAIDDLADEEVPPQWSVMQGWSKWFPVQGLDDDDKPTGMASGISGHNLLIIDVHTETKKTLTLESNYPNSINLKGPGFRSMGIKTLSGTNTRKITRNNSSGDIDNHEKDEIIDPNKGIHWTEKVEVTWEELKNGYDARDPQESVKIARLKIYDLNWAKPIL